MRQAHLLALPLLTLSLCAFAQTTAPAQKPDPVPDNQPFELKLETPPAPSPDRLVLNRSKAEFRIWYEGIKQAEAVAGPAANPMGIPVPPTAGSVPPVVEPAGGTGLSLAQPGLPPAAAATAASAASPAPVMTAPAVTEPPAPVPRTMAQAAEALPKPVETALSKPPVAAVQAEEPTRAPDADASPKLLDKVQTFVKTHRKEALMGAGAIVLLLVLVLRAARRRGSDDADE